MCNVCVKLKENNIISYKCSYWESADKQQNSPGSISLWIFLLYLPGQTDGTCSELSFHALEASHITVRDKFFLAVNKSSNLKRA